MLAMNALVRNPPALTPTLSRGEKELYRGGFGFNAIACRPHTITKIPNQSPLPPGVYGPGT